MRSAALTICILFIIRHELISQTVAPGFSAPDTVCVNSPVNILNTTTGATSYFWNFCSASLATTTPEVTDLGNVSGNLSQPVFMDYVYSNNKYYGFITNHIPGALIRLDFGNSLLNTPTSVNLGDFGGIIPTANGSEGIQIVQNEGKWYIIIVGGNTSQGTPPRVLKIDFGTDIANPTPTATNWGNLGNMEQPVDLHVFKEGNNWYGLTVNAVTNTITRFSFTNSFDNTPTGSNLGNIGNIAYPTGIYAVNEEGNWKVFITNSGSTDPNSPSSLTRLDFGNSLLNTPTGVNLGNPGNTLHKPRDITIIRSCGETIGFAVNGDQSYNDIVKMDFNNNLNSTPASSSLGNFGQLHFPHSISKFFRIQNDVYAFITNVSTNTLSRLKFAGCSNSDIPSSSLQNPASISYNSPGKYTINLTVDLGLPTQDAYCKSIYVKDCRDAILSTDTTICNGGSAKLQAIPAVGYKWTPDAYLNNPLIQNPIATPSDTTKFYVEALIPTGNLIANGNFSSGNTGFTSGYNYTSINFTEGEYSVGKNPQLWNTGMSACGDHTSGTGNMMLLNGSPVANAEVWKEVISVTPNTDYAFTTWIQPLSTPNPATLSFSINGTSIGNLIKATLPTCTWSQFYATWNSGANTTAVISIVNKNTQISGNDFALDDISFSAYQTIKDSVVVNVEKISVKANNDTLICPGSPVQLTASGANIYSWTPATGLSNVSIYNPVATPASAMQYIVAGSSPRGCIAKDTVNIDLYPKPVVQISKDTEICANAPVQLLASGGVSYKWSPATGLSDPDIANPIATVSAGSKYSVTVTDANTCTNKDSVSILVQPYPGFSATQNIITCLGATVMLSANGGDTYSWTPAESLSSPTSATTSATPSGTTTYSVYILDSVCNYDTTINVKVSVAKGTGRFILPNAFTPNGDGKNDCFGIKEWGDVQIKTFIIYNRWGQVVFKTKNPSDCWDGTFNGQKQSAGAYPYIIEATTVCGVVQRKGILTLIR